MKIILDSNVLIADFWLESIPSKMLLENSKKGKVDLYIPKVVVDETYNKFRERINAHSNNIFKELKSFEKLSKQKISLEIDKKKQEEIIEEYKQFFGSIIKANNITIIDYPIVSHEYLAQKAMLKKKPFNENEKGYRDSLIWENIKSLISSEDIEIPATPELIFITKNHKDFIENNELHRDLIEDLENHSLNTESIEIIESLSMFKDKILNYYFEQSKTFKNRLERNDFWDFEFIPSIQTFLNDELTDKYIDNYHSFAPMANDDPTINYVSEEYEIEEIEVKKINAKEYLVDVKIKIDLDIDYYVDKSDYWSSNEATFSAVDLDWNDYVVAVSDLVNVSIELSLIINNNLEIEKIEIIKINDNYE